MDTPTVTAIYWDRFRVQTDVGEIPFVRPTGGPPIIEHPAFTNGRPVSVYDLQYNQEWTIPLVLGLHAFPDRGATGWGLMTSAEIHDVHKSRRGRPLRFTVEQARAIKDAYWTGAKTIRALALTYNVTETTIARIVHGLTYWYA